MTLDVVSIGCKVRLYDAEFEEEIEYSIVGSTEADSLNNKISNESPVGAALLGRKPEKLLRLRHRQALFYLKFWKFKGQIKKGVKNMAQERNGQEQDINQLLKVRRDKLKELQDSGRDRLC